MKKSLLLTLGLGALSASPLMATTYDLFITGSTAFRANVFTACQKLYDNGAPINIAYGTSTTGGNSPQGTVSKNTQWTMSGTVSNIISSVGPGNSLNIHAYFTGSVQGMQTVEQEQKIIFVDASGNAMTNTPTIAFSDVDSSSTPYPIPGEFSDCAEAAVCVQPFVMVKSVATTASITNITWDIIRSAIQPGRVPLSLWTHNPTDHSTEIYLVERTHDSGTRRTELAEVQFPYNENDGVYLWDNGTNNAFWKPPTSSTVIVGAAGNAGANLQWGSGYVAGSDVANQMSTNFPGNQSFGILSISDAKSITGVNWSQVLPFGNTWPTAAGAGITTTTTNDFTPICLGQYSLWAYEKCIYPDVAPSSRASGDQNLSQQQLGDTSTPGSILYTLLAVATSTTQTPVTGSIDNEIQLSKTVSPGATAVRICDMVSSRSSVGGTITP